MTTNSQMPEGVVADSAGNWVDRSAPAAWRPYLRLSRADRPIGTWLLYIPCLWALSLAILADGRFGAFDVWIIVSAGVGAFLMRGAGCTWNDITDRDIDASVARTRSRPIPSGQVGVRAAIAWMLVQTFVSLLILLSYPGLAIFLGVLLGDPCRNLSVRQTVYVVAASIPWDCVQLGRVADLGSA